jgi:hypothetical protein
VAAGLLFEREDRREAAAAAAAKEGGKGVWDRVAQWSWRILTGGGQGGAA